MKFIYKTISAGVFCCIALQSPVSAAQTFGLTDFHDIAQTSLYNAAAFGSKYKGKSFSGDFHFLQTSDYGSGLGLMIIFSDPTGAGAAICKLSGTKDIKLVSTLKGTENIRVSGIIRGWSNGFLHLKQCSFAIK